VTSRLEKYRALAAECARLALRFSDEKIKRGYQELANSWNTLANDAERPCKQSQDRETA
jgi:hypothetical protein